jgi:hypothetical protein
MAYFFCRREAKQESKQSKPRRDKGKVKKKEKGFRKRQESYQKGGQKTMRRPGSMGRWVRREGGRGGD